MTKWFERRGHPIGTCNECLAWGHFFARRLCAACYMVDHKDRWPRAKCESCRRRVRVRRGYCRLCWDNARTLAHDTGNPKITAVDQIAEVRHQQLFFANMAALAAPSRSGTRRSRSAEQRGPRIPAAPRKKTGQLTLFRRNNRGTLVSVQRLEKPANAPETVAPAPGHAPSPRRAPSVPPGTSSLLPRRSSFPGLTASNEPGVVQPWSRCARCSVWP
jgi:hypothetical protein